MAQMNKKLMDMVMDAQNEQAIYSLPVPEEYWLPDDRDAGFIPVWNQHGALIGVQIVHYNVDEEGEDVAFNGDILTFPDLLPEEEWASIIDTDEKIRMGLVE